MFFFRPTPRHLPILNIGGNWFYLTRINNCNPNIQKLIHMKSFNIIQSNPNSSGGFVTKLQNQTTVTTPFGDKVKKETYYVSGSKQMKPDTKIAVDMAMFKVVEHPMINPSNDETFMGKWLHLA